MGLDKRIDAAVSAAIAAVMDTYARERTGHLLPPLSWSLDAGGFTVRAAELVVGCPDADYVDDEVLIRWAEALGLTPAPVASVCAGSVAYSGMVDDRAVLVWGVVDRDTWETPGGGR